MKIQKVPATGSIPVAEGATGDQNVETIDCALLDATEIERLTLSYTDLMALGINPNKKSEYRGWTNKKYQWQLKPDQFASLDELEVMVRMRYYEGDGPNIDTSSPDNSYTMGTTAATKKSDKNYKLVDRWWRETAVYMTETHIKNKKTPHCQYRYIGPAIRRSYWFCHPPNHTGLYIAKNVSFD